MKGRLLRSGWNRTMNLIDYDKVNYEIWSDWFFERLDLFSDSFKFYQNNFDNKKYNVVY